MVFCSFLIRKVSELMLFLYISPDLITESFICFIFVRYFLVFSPKIWYSSRKSGDFLCEKSEFFMEKDSVISLSVILKEGKCLDFLCEKFSAFAMFFTLFFRTELSTGNLTVFEVFLLISWKLELDSLVVKAFLSLRTKESSFFSCIGKGIACLLTMFSSNLSISTDEPKLFLLQSLNCLKIGIFWHFKLFMVFFQFLRFFQI